MISYSGIICGGWGGLGDGGGGWYQSLSLSFFPTSGTYLTPSRALYISLEIHRNFKNLSLKGFVFC